MGYKQNWIDEDHLSNYHFSKTTYKLTFLPFWIFYLISLIQPNEEDTCIIKTRKSLFLTMVSTHGIKNVQSYPGLVQSEINMNDLFQIID